MKGDWTYDPVTSGGGFIVLRSLNHHYYIISPRAAYKCFTCGGEWWMHMDWMNHTCTH